MALAHTPYDGSAKPFTIGLKPLDLGDWIEPGDALEPYLAEKDRLFSDHREMTIRATPESRAAQEEALALLVRTLPERFPDLYRRDGPRMAVGGSGRSVDLADDAMPPLERAARLVPEDLVLMEKQADGWRLSAAALAFPSSWSLAEKFDRSITEIHHSVPDFSAGTRNAALVERIFDKLLVDQPVWRPNWSIYPDAALHHPKNKVERGDRFVPKVGPYDTFLRVERQTLRKLPQTGAILFTIRIHVDPLAAIAAHEDAARLATSLRTQIEVLTPPQIAYMGLIPTRDRLIAELSAIAAG
ncbi:MAG: heme-dependent oxidative N-demethylase family protein [Pararhizobium sp.]